MATTALTVNSELSVLAIAHACISRLTPSTQRAYLAPITIYLSSPAYMQFGLTRESIQSWLTSRKRDHKAGAVTLNIALAALKLLAREVWIRGHIDGAQYNAIADIKSEKIKGQRLGQWTDELGVEKLLEACMDARERAIIAVMCGCGLRRSEVAGLQWTQYQEWHGRKVIADITGKGGRVRTVAVPEWAREVIDEYQQENEK